MHDSAPSAPPVARPVARNARAEADDALGPGFAARILEPSPPAVDDGEWYADDPVTLDTSDGNEDGPGAQVVSPVPTGDITWDALVAQRPDLEEFAADRWLGAWRRLPDAPHGLAETRTALNALTFYVLSAARRQATGKIALRSTYRGFGTPLFGEDRQLRVEGTWLVAQAGDDVRAEPLSTLTAAAQLAGVTLDPTAGDDFDVPPLGDPDAELAVDPSAAAFLADWFGVGTSVLEEIRALSTPDDKPSRVQLWAEHFDVAFEIGDVDAGSRASFGASPGDAAHPEPYLYVAPWSTPQTDRFWNDSAFSGASLPLAELRDAANQREAAVAFMRRGVELLKQSAGTPAEVASGS